MHSVLEIVLLRLLTLTGILAAKTAKLHADAPTVYKDPNHKPELICALEDFVGMCGFRSAPEVCAALKSVAELRALLGEEVSAAYESRCGAEPEAALEALFGTLMRSDPGKVAEQLTALESRLGAAGVAAAPSATNADEVQSVVLISTTPLCARIRLMLLL